MNPITDEGRKLAAELANAELVRRGMLDPGPFSDLSNFSEGSSFSGFVALARLATDHLALKAEHEKAVGDLREIDRIADVLSASPGGQVDQILTIAAKYRETDPLVEALIQNGNNRPEWATAMALSLRERFQIIERGPAS